jgi:hypothetical protein
VPKHHRSAEDCEKAGVPVAGLTAEYTDEQAAAFYAGVMARMEGSQDDPDETPEDIELKVPYERGFAYADANTPDNQAHVYGQGYAESQPDPSEKVDSPPEGIRIDPAQRGGSTRGNEENTGPHAGSPTTDRQVAKEHKDRQRSASSGRQHPGSRGDAQATQEERDSIKGETHTRAGEPGKRDQNKDEPERKAGK